MTIEQITAQWMEARRVDIIERQKALNMRASGRSAESLEVVEKPGNVALWGLEYLGAQEYGRKPSEVANDPPILYQEIRKWMRDKGLREKGNFNAYVITRRIHEKGTRLYRALRGENNGAQPLGITAIIENKLPELQERLGDGFALFVQSAILKRFQKDE